MGLVNEKHRQREHGASDFALLKGRLHLVVKKAEFGEVVAQLD